MTEVRARYRSNDKKYSEIVLACRATAPGWRGSEESLGKGWEVPSLAAGSFRTAEGCSSSVLLHRIPEWSGWKGPLWVTQPKPLPKQGHL